MKIVMTGFLASIAGILAAAGAFVTFWLWIPAVAFAVPALRMSKQNI